jgi:NADPH:quinone reductase-like Zn-dependent oxidoreductase
MEAFFLKKNGSAEEAFELRKVPALEPKPTEIVIESEAFGLNFADVMARKGLYQDCPPLPTVIGYEAVGTIIKTGSEVSNLKIGQRVVVFTRFGGYARQVATEAIAATPIPNDIDAGKAAALATQYCTAYYASHEMVNLHEGQRVVIDAAAGGVGTALIQMAKHKKCIVFGGVGSDEKMDYLKNLGVDYPVNYRKQNLYKEAQRIIGEAGADVVFNSLGGTTIKNAIGILGAGGRLVAFGNAESSDRSRSALGTLKMVWNFGLLLPPLLLLHSRSFIGVNMLRIADHRKEVLQRCLQNVVSMYEQKIIDPVVGASFESSQLAEAHEFLESRKSTGKIIVRW